MNVIICTPRCPGAVAHDPPPSPGRALAEPSPYRAVGVHVWDQPANHKLVVQAHHIRKLVKVGVEVGRRDLDLRTRAPTTIPGKRGQPVRA
jgi:hypothetical protein